MMCGFGFRLSRRPFGNPKADDDHCRLGVRKAPDRSFMLNSSVYATILEMVLTRSFKKTVVARIERDPAFAKALLDEAATLFLSDEPETAGAIFRELVNATLGFEQLARFRRPTRAHPRG